MSLSATFRALCCVAKPSYHMSNLRNGHFAMSNSVVQTHSGQSRGWGGHSGTKWLPAVKRSRGAEGMNTKIYVRSTPLKEKNGGRSTSNYVPNKGSNL